MKSAKPSAWSEQAIGTFCPVGGRPVRFYIVQKGASGFTHHWVDSTPFFPFYLLPVLLPSRPRLSVFSLSCFSPLGTLAARRRQPPPRSRTICRRAPACNHPKPRAATHEHATRSSHTTNFDIERSLSIYLFQ